MAWKILTREAIEETKRQFAAEGYVAQWYAIAAEVILTTLGPDWWKANILPSASKPDEFLVTKDETEDGNYEHQDRLVTLGHMLYALKDCKGYETFIEALKTRDLEPVFFELTVANQLQKSGCLVEFVEQTGLKGADFSTGQKMSLTCGLDG